MAFTLTGTGGALYTYLFFLRLGEARGYTMAEVTAIGLVFLGALIIFIVPHLGFGQVLRLEYVRQAAKEINNRFGSGGFE